jgi:hypothetical protein
MTKEKLSAVWTATCTEKDCEPQGALEAAQRAINFLGPFKYKTDDEACRHAPPRNGSRIRVSEEFAISRVYDLARMFNGVQTLTNGAPRRKDIVECLDKLERTNFLMSKGIDDPDRVDRGGNTNLIREDFGSAQYQLVQEGRQASDKLKSRALPLREIPWLM